MQQPESLIPEMMFPSKHSPSGKCWADHAASSLRPESSIRSFREPSKHDWPVG